MDKSNPELPLEVAEEMKNFTTSLTGFVSQFAIKLNDKAIRTAERQMAVIMHAISDQGAQAEQELIDATHTVDDLEAMLEESQVNNKNLKQDLEKERALSDQLMKEVAQLKRHLDTSEQISTLDEASPIQLSASLQRKSFVEQQTFMNQATSWLVSIPLPEDFGANEG